ncbi:MAG: glutathione S-transferase C-terminal domain-containing protein [Burkholderiaceae bacterium]
MRRIDLSICEPLANGYRAAEGLKMFKDRFRVLPEAADGLKAIARDNLAWLDANLGSRPFICGDRFSLADILLYAFLVFGARVGQPVDPALSHITAWMEGIASRPSAKA